MDIITIKSIVSDYHIDSIVDAIKSMALCGIILFGVVIIVSFYFDNKLSDYSSIATFKVGTLSYIGLIYSIILRIASGMVVKSQLDKE